MRIFSRAATLALSLMLCAPISATAVDIPASFSFTGSGFGHGVGMSQFGARGQALEGKSAADILQYYFTGVSVEPVHDAQNMRVNIGHLLTSLTIKMDSALGEADLIAGDAKEATDVTPIKIFGSKESLTFTLLGSSIFPNANKANRAVEALASGKSWTLRWSGTRYLPGPDAIISVKIGNTTTKYRYGEIQIKVVKAAALGPRIEITNTVRLHDEYLWGISEMPSSWPLAAMQAQAIASRTYALNRVGSVKSACDCDIYGSSQDQTFVGYAKESEAKYGKLWKAAVSSTSSDESSGYVVLANSLPINAYYFSSSGGVTETAQNAWGAPVAYAQSVPDPWSLDLVANPRYAHWERTVLQSVIATAFSLPDVVTLRIAAKNATGTCSLIIATSSAGATSQLSGAVFRSRTKMPSTWFDLTTPQMNPAPAIPTATPTPSQTPTPIVTLTERSDRL